MFILHFITLLLSTVDYTSEFTLIRENFSKEYTKGAHLSKDSEGVNKETKSKLIENFVVALTATQSANSQLKKHSGIILKSMDELMKQNEIKRSLIENKNTKSPNKQLSMK